MSISIRKAKINELKIIQDLNHDLFASDGPRDQFLNHEWPYEDGKKYFIKRMSEPNSICLVAIVDNQIIGYLAGELLKTESWRPVKRIELQNMFVKDQFRNLGVGKKLVSEFLKWSKSKGVKKVLVVAYVTNQRAINFYEKSGFEPESLSLEANV